jgi:hypothetical protein
VSIKSFFTSFFDSIADSSGLFNFREELFMAAVQDEYQNDIEGRVKFDAVVLQINFPHPAENTPDTGYGVRTVKVRPLELHNFIIPDPCEFKIKSLMEFVISLHPTAYSDGDVKTRQTLAVGDVIECYYDIQGPSHEGTLRGLRFTSTVKSRQSGHHNYECLKSLSGLTTTGSERVRTNTPTGVLGDTSPPTGDTGYPNEWGLEPQKGEYQGTHIAVGTQVLNGFPVQGSQILGKPNSDYWTVSGGGGGYLLKDYLNPNWTTGQPGANFNGLAKQFFEDKGRKFKSNGFRPFIGQLNVRKKHVSQGKCAEMKSIGRAPCPSARPGTSNHGWGGAVDVKTSSGGLIGWNSEEFEWMTENAEKYGFHHPAWAKKRAEGGTNPEAWHWEPKSKVIKK